MAQIGQQHEREDKDLHLVDLHEGGLRPFLQNWPWSGGHVIDHIISLCPASKALFFFIFHPRSIRPYGQISA